MVPTSAPASASLANGLCLRYVNQINSFLLSWFWSVLSPRQKETKEFGTGEKSFMGFGEDCGCPWDFGKIVECLELNGLFCGNLKDKNLEGNADDGNLVYEASEPLKD